MMKSLLEKRLVHERLFFIHRQNMLFVCTNHILKKFSNGIN